ncbi:hypothetical protein AD947_00735 [Acetobacter tropicalis]|uniref:Uncharacterized protein n=2 Tax=Acetobacter tropicalis TaxID=104102 RepID=A0A149U7Q6_9PROT|nr:hypothetical protein AD947_00735 [Acetobacter tropicalis]
MGGCQDLPKMDEQQRIAIYLILLIFIASLRDGALSVRTTMQNGRPGAGRHNAVVKARCLS